MKSVVHRRDFFFVYKRMQTQENLKYVRQETVVDNFPHILKRRRLQEYKDYKHL